MADISTTLAVNVSASLTYSSLSLATATKTSSATCLNKSGAKFEDLGVISNTTFKTYATLGSITLTKKYWLYVENYDTTADYIVIPNADTLTIHATLAWAVGTTYVDNVIVTDASRYWRSLAGSNTGNTPSTQSVWWSLLDVLYVPFGRSIVLVTKGPIQILALTAPTLGQCKVLAIQDEA